MEVEAIQRARARITALRSGETSKAELTEVVTRAREELEELSKTAAELKASVPEQVREGIREAIHAEVLPVARHIAEVRGLSTQLIKRVERAQSSIESEREARIDDLDVLVDLLVSNWQGLEARLARIEARLGEAESAEQATDELGAEVGQGPVVEHVSAVTEPTSHSSAVG